VEHPVTEAITGVDLVEMQLRVAAGERLPFTQQDLLSTCPKGHSFEARVYAESPARNFLPGAGKVLRWSVPPGAGAFEHAAIVRVDSGVREGDSVGTNYDPMIAKIVTHGADREEALAMLRKALAETQVSVTFFLGHRVKAALLHSPPSIPNLVFVVSAMSHLETCVSFLTRTAHAPPAPPGCVLPSVPAHTGGWPSTNLHFLLTLFPFNYTSILPL
jgi:hypothetical protein